MPGCTIWRARSVAHCGTSLEPVDPEDCPRDSDLAACDKVACGVLCEGDGECGTDGGLDNCGGPNGVRFDVYRKICGEKDKPARAPARPDLEPRAEPLAEVDPGAGRRRPPDRLRRG